MSIIKNKEEIIGLLEKIIEKSTIINRYKDRIPQIEIDLILSDIRNLYEKYYQLNSITIEETDEFKNASRRKDNEIVREEIKPEEKVIPIEPLKIVKKEDPIEIAEPQIAKEIKKESHTTNLSFTTNQIIAEKFKDDSNSINDKIGLSKTDNSIASKINEHHLNDIRKGIGINDKFLFIKELFNGNVGEYDESINKINLFTTVLETNVYIDSQKNKYNWDEKSEAFIAFKKLVDRKFS